jgi:imidazolonepropionase-like amidohydrolase
MNSILTLVYSCQVAVKHDYLISDINIIDVTNGNVLTHQWIGIDSNRITKIYDKKVNYSTSTKIIKGDSKFLIPGLWDMHAHYHWNYDWSAPFWIANGVIGLRDMTGDISNVLMIRKMMHEGTFFGPDIISSDGLINGHFDYNPPKYLVEDSITAIETVNKQKADGVDFMKIYSHLNREAYFAIAKQAKKVDLDFAGHLPESISVFEAITAGQKSLEHNLGILEATANSSDTNYSYFLNLKGKVPNWRIDMYDFLIKNHSKILLDSMITQLANSNTWLCPTMVALNGIAFKKENPFNNDIRNKYIPQDMYEQFINMSNKDTAWSLALRRKYEFDKNLFKRMIDGGVRFLAGSDFPCKQVYPGFSLHEELKILYDLGFSPLQALQTATLNPAIFLDKLDKYGTIDNDKIASILILNSNPLDNIENTKDIEAVFLKGKYFSRSDLDSLLNVPVY